jgi:hypothetical protein
MVLKARLFPPLKDAGFRRDDFYESVRHALTDPERR